MGSAGARRRAGRIGSRARDSSGLVFGIFTRKILLEFFGEQSKQSQGQSDSDGALSSFSLFTFRYPSNDGILRMVDSQGDYLMIFKCNEELSPHHHSEAVRIGFLRIKRTVILADRPIFVPRDCVSMRASGGPSTSSDLEPNAQLLSKMAPEPAKEAVDAVAYFNEAWTPYHAVLATCRRLIDAGYEVRARAPSPSSLE